MTEPKSATEHTSIDKALDLCEALAGAPRGMTVSEAARALKQPAPTVHRLLSVLKRRGFVRQDEETARYSLTLRMLDLSFRLLGRSELRLHAYPVLREFVLRTAHRTFLAIPAAGEVTYVWSAGPDAASMHTVYGKEMPGHCAMYFEAGQATRRLTCLRLTTKADVLKSDAVAVRLGPPDVSGDAAPRLSCTCAPVLDYTAREVARVGVFSHWADESPILTEHNRTAWELARLVSVRLGYLHAAAAGVTP